MFWKLQRQLESKTDSRDRKDCGLYLDLLHQKYMCYIKLLDLFSLLVSLVLLFCICIIVLQFLYEMCHINKVLLLLLWHEYIVCDSDAHTMHLCVTTRLCVCILYVLVCVCMAYAYCMPWSAPNPSASLCRCPAHARAAVEHGVLLWWVKCLRI